MKKFFSHLIYHHSALIVIPLIVGCQFITAQDSDISKFTSLQSGGTIPDHFRSLSIEKYREQSKDVENSGESQFDKKNQKVFYRYSNFMIDELMLSGKIVFNDPVSVYINEIAARLLKDEPELKSSLKFYTAKSPIYNASSTDQGIIFVNTGLIARLRSEAQLAFVLSHEIAHYVKKHNINSYLQNQRILHSKGMYKGTDSEQKILNMNHMSEDDELEADEIGYEKYFKNSGYKLSEIDSLFHYMVISECPFSETEFSYDFFEDEYYKFPASYHTDSIKAIDFAEILKEQEEMEEDEIGKHPAIDKRALIMKRMKLKENDTDKKLFLISEERFRHVRNLCILESIRQQMLSRNYIDAVYNCYAYLQQFPDNKFLEYTLASALYQISHRKTFNDNYIYKYDEYSEEGSKQGREVQRTQFLFDKLKPAEATTLALRYLDKVIRKYGQTDYTRLILDDLLSDLFIVNKHKFSEFLTEADFAGGVSINDPNQKENQLYYLNALAKSMEEESYLVKSMKKWDEERKRIEQEEKEYENLSNKEKAAIRKEKKRSEKMEKAGYFLANDTVNIDKIVIVDPKYLRISNRPNDPIDLEKTELHKLRYNERIASCSSESNLSVDLINSKNLQANSTEVFNNLSYLNEWLEERISDNMQYSFVPYSAYATADISDFYNTDYFLWTGVFSEKKKKEVLAAIGASLLFTYGLTLPVVLVWAALPSYRVYYYALLFDIRTGDTKLVAYDEYKGSDLSGDFVKSSVYDTFKKIDQ